MAERARLGEVASRCGAPPLSPLRRGKVFGRLNRMAEACSCCGLSFEREAGYFVGAIYLNYGVTVLLALAGYFLLEVWLSPPVGWQVWLWSAFAVVFPIWFYRYSKALWLGLDHLVDPGGRGAPPGPRMSR